MESKRKYPSDLSDQEWEQLKAYPPAPKWRGRPRLHSTREILDAVFYVLKSGCQWRMLPREFPPWKTVFHYFRKWRLDGTWERLNRAMRERLRVRLGRDPQPSTGIFDSQSAKTTGVGGEQRGFDGGKKVRGRKRHLLVDTEGLVVEARVHSAKVPDQDGIRRLLEPARSRLGRLSYLWVDAGYRGRGKEWVEQALGLKVEVVNRSPKPTPEKMLRVWAREWFKEGHRMDLKKLPTRPGFEILSRCWVAERTFAWISHNRRMSKDYERLCATSEAFVYAAMSRIMVKRLACVWGFSSGLARGTVSGEASLVGMRGLPLCCRLRPLLGEAKEAKCMLRTRLCELLGIEHPVIQASIGPWSSAELVAAVSNAGGLGSVGTALWAAEHVGEQILRVRELTDRPFAVNHVVRPFNEEAFALTLEAKPKVVSFAMGDPGDLVERAHDASILFMQQVHTVGQARRASEKDVDAIIAQGFEAAGFGSTVSTMSLLPQVVDAVSPIPVVAAGGIANGRRLAEALVLGAQGVNVGTRFLASEEAGIDDEWKRRIVAAESEDTIKVEFADHVFPPPSREGGYGTLPRVLRTPFVEEWNSRREEAEREAERLSNEMITAVREGRGHELVPFTGQTAGMIHEILPAGEITRELVREAEEALRTATRLPR